MNYYDKNIIEIHNDLINKKVTSKELIDFSKNKILETNETNPVYKGNNVFPFERLAIPIIWAIPYGK